MEDFTRSTWFAEILAWWGGELFLRPHRHHRSLQINLSSQQHATSCKSFSPTYSYRVSLSLSPYSLATYNIGTRYINNFKFLADTLMENLKGENHLIGHARGRTLVQARAKRYMS